MNIYVGNLSYETTEQDLIQAFSAFGEVTAVNVIKDRMTNRPRGFAFVTMGSAEAGAAAIKEMNGKELMGRTLKVNEARPREERPAGGGGFRGPRRDGGFRPRGGFNGQDRGF